MYCKRPGWGRIVLQYSLLNYIAIGRLQEASLYHNTNGLYCDSGLPAGTECVAIHSGVL